MTSTDTQTTKRGMFALSGRSALYTVMAKTIRDLLGARRVIVAILGGQALAMFLSLVAWADAFEVGRMGLDMQTSYLVGYFITVSFFWMTGLFLAYMVVGTSGLELVDQERKRGTLLLIVSKPIGRLQFLAGKFLALVLTAALLEAAILLVSAMAVKALLGFGPHVLTALLKVLPWIFLFSLLVIVVFTAVSVALSTLVRSALVRNGVFTLVLVAVFAVGPVMRMAWPDIYEDYRVYYFDGGYNLGNVYVDILDQTATVRLGPQAQAWLGITTGAYRAGAEELLTALVGAEGAFDPDIGAMPPSMERSTYVSPAVSLVGIVAVAVAVMAVAAIAFRREDVQ
ncbi:MAG: ABC transporter permease [SAR202 cluster bacterium]|nr:hypothetical protein [Chloroflexota bacterium]MDP6421318.1 ABC transporter permease [SAR202 cluster bacterium]MQG59038.1 ABC transporter permease [SAR202 cluster bacterium]MQG69681.1 ABC transporter permease [SAR202 cluster bacterium]HAL49599.1 hypothetical protein [Dehalococcoidia bacterium]|tara:strand:- start:5845 stop:6867 length:1023 start_codon:yes stop_codon:yes gene_type:complete